MGYFILGINAYKTLVRWAHVLEAFRLKANSRTVSFTSAGGFGRELWGCYRFSCFYTSTVLCTFQNCLDNGSELN